MSLNNTPLTEISKSLLDGLQISVSTADLITGFPIEAPDGSAAAPTYSFASNPDTGLTRGSAGISAVVDTEVGMISGGLGNVGVGAIPSNYGGGEGVLFLADAAVDPVGAPNGGSGGILYVSGTTLVYLNSLGVTTVLSGAGTSDVSGPAAATDEEVARYADATGGIVTTSGVFYSGTQLRVGDGSASVPSFAFTSDPDTGIYLSGGSLSFSAGGVTGLSASASTTTLHVAAQVLNGSAASPTLTFTSDATSGLSGGAGATRFSSGGVIGMLVDTLANTQLVGSDLAFGTAAAGVLKLSDASTDPVGVPNGGSGGILYVAGGGTQLRYLDASGSDIHVGGDLAGVGAVSDGQVLVWSDTTGSAVVARAIITDAGGIAAVQSATLTNPAYSFTGDTTTGLALAGPGHLRVVGGGSTYLDITSSDLTFAQPLLFDHTSTSGAPALSFSSNTSVGIWGTAGDAQVVRTSSFSNDALFSSTNNVTLASPTASYGSTTPGQGVVCIANGSAPTSAPVGGGVLFVDGNDLKWRGEGSAAEVTLTTSNLVAPVASSTDNAAARWNGAGGLTLQDSSVIITDTDQVQAVSAQGYRFVSSATSGLFSGGADSLQLASGGTTGLTLSSSGLVVAAAHVVGGVDGSAAAPSLTFTSDANTGLYLASTNTTAVSTGGTRALTAGPNNNIAFGSDTPDFAGGEAVVYFSDVTTVPSGALGVGGLLYVNGRDLYFHNNAGTASKLSGVGHAGSSTDHALVRWSSTTGRNIQDTSALTITDGDQILVPDGTTGAPGYSLEVSNTGVSLSGATLQIGDGGAQLSLSSSGVVASVACTTDSSLRVGGAGGCTTSFSSPTSSSNIANVSGTFVWQQNGTSIMQTDTDENLDMLTNNVVFSGATGTFTLGDFGSNNYTLSLSDAADSCVFRVGATDILTIGDMAVTVNNLEVDDACLGASGGVNGYGFSSTNTTGLVYISNSQLRANASPGFVGQTSSRMGILSDAVSAGNKYVMWGEATTAPTSLPSPGVGVYLYQVAGSFMRVADDKKDVALNGPHARGKWTRTATILTGSDTLVDTLVDDTGVTNLMTVDTAAPGAGTITGTADTAGWWEVAAEAHWDANATGYRKLRILVGGVEVGLGTQNAVTVGGVETQQQVCACVNVVASAVMTVRVEQNSGGNLDVDVTASAVYLG